MSRTVNIAEFEAYNEDVSKRLGGLQAANIQILDKLDKLCDRPTVGLDFMTITSVYLIELSVKPFEPTKPFA